MWSSSTLLAGLFILLSLPGCGYHLTARMPYALPEGISTLFLSEVTNPTTNSWLGPRLRTEFIDEMSKQGGIAWVDAGEAEGKIALDILSFRKGAKLENAEEKTVRSEMVLSLEARLYSSRDNVLLARTGRLAARESYNPQSGSEEIDARNRVVELAAELAVQRLNQSF